MLDLHQYKASSGWAPRPGALCTRQELGMARFIARHLASVFHGTLGPSSCRGISALLVYLSVCSRRGFAAGARLSTAPAGYYPLPAISTYAQYFPTSTYGVLRRVALLPLSVPLSRTRRGGARFCARRTAGSGLQHTLRMGLFKFVFLPATLRTTNRATATAPCSAAARILWFWMQDALCADDAFSRSWRAYRRTFSTVTQTIKWKKQTNIAG